MNHREQIAWQREVIGEETLDMLNSREALQFELTEEEIDDLILQKRESVDFRRKPLANLHRKM